MKEYKVEDLYLFPYCDGEKIEYRVCELLGETTIEQSYYDDFIGRGGKTKYNYEVYNVLFHEGILERRVSGASSLGVSIEVIFGKDYCMTDGAIRGFDHLDKDSKKETYTEEQLKEFEVLINSESIIPDWIQENDRRYFVNKGILSKESMAKK